MTKIISKTSTLKDGTTITIRPIEISDIENYINFCTHMFATSDYVITRPEEFSTSIEQQKQRIQNLKNNQNSITLLAIYNNEIIGNIDFHSNAKRRKIRHKGEFGMGVKANWRGRGIGKLLINELFNWAKQEDCPIEKIELKVLSKNKPALKLYKKMGFKKEGLSKKEVKMEDGSYLDSVSMSKFI